MRYLWAAILLAGVLGFPSGASTQTNRTIRFVVPFGAGGTADLLGRLLAEEIGKAHGVTTVIENRAGGGTVIATEAVSRAVPDGNTVLLNANAFVIAPHLRKLTYDPLTSFTPICQLVSSPQVIVVNGASPYRSLGQMLDAARAKPGAVTLASVGPASTQHIAFEMLKHLAGVNMVFVPFAGGNAPAVNALLGQHVSPRWLITPRWRSNCRMASCGHWRPRRGRGSSAARRAGSGGTGLCGFRGRSLVRRRRPGKDAGAIVTELEVWFTAAMEAPAVKRKLTALGLYPVGKCGAAFAADLRRRYDEYGRVLREANLTTE